MYDFLRKVALFADLPEPDLARLCAMIEEVAVPAGADLFVEGSRGDQAYVIKSGELEVLKISDGRSLLLAVRKSGDVIGELALLEDAPRSATVRARTDSLLYAIDQKQFNHLLSTSPAAAQHMLSIILGRWRSTAVALRQSEKMAQLGTLTAGVAHELNNPAAAVKRGAGQLEEAFANFAAVQGALATLALAPPQQVVLADLLQSIRAAAGKPAPYLDALARSDREYELETWLDEHDVPAAWTLAPTLANLDFDSAGLASFAGQFAPEQLATVVNWMEAAHTVYSLLAEIGQGAGRIAEIVKALKSYAYLGQAPVQAVDIHEGLDNTLLILRSKLANIRVLRDYAPDLPKIEGYGSELNQVWTNLIDNAADALAHVAGAEILVKTAHEDGWVTVEVRDNGPGIPPEIQPRIFDPFFTTKPPGKGTGLGLDISYNIVVAKHRGGIEVFSRAGNTTFRVTLPVNFAADTIRAPSSATDVDDERLREILRNVHTIAVAGVSADPNRPAYTIPAYLQAQGYRVIPVNPNLDFVLGEKAYPDLLAIPEPVDIVAVFRRSDEVVEIVAQAIQIGAHAVWLHEGIVNEEAAQLARQAGLVIVMDNNIRTAHTRLLDPAAT